jgi:hypothetical protein
VLEDHLPGQPRMGSSRRRQLNAMALWSLKPVAPVGPTVPSQPRTPTATRHLGLSWRLITNSNLSDFSCASLGAGDLARGLAGGFEDGQQRVRWRLSFPPRRERQAIAGFQRYSRLRPSEHPGRPLTA